MLEGVWVCAVLCLSVPVEHAAECSDDGQEVFGCVAGGCAAVGADDSACVATCAGVAGAPIYKGGKPARDDGGGGTVRPHVEISAEGHIGGALAAEETTRQIVPHYGGGHAPVGEDGLAVCEEEEGIVCEDLQVLCVRIWMICHKRIGGWWIIGFHVCWSDYLGDISRVKSKSFIVLDLHKIKHYTS